MWAINYQCTNALVGEKISDYEQGTFSEVNSDRCPTLNTRQKMHV